MDGIRAGGLGYPGGRTGNMGNQAMAGNMSHGFGSLGYAGGRTGYMAQFDNHAFGNVNQAVNQVNQGPVNQGPANNGPLKAINSVAFGRGTFSLPFFGTVSKGKAVGALALVLGFAYSRSIK